VTNQSQMPLQFLACSPPQSDARSLAAGDIQDFAVRLAVRLNVALRMRRTLTCHGVPRNAPEVEPTPK
jgi:hypothetical protein